MKFLIVRLADETPAADFQEIANEMLEVSENTTFISLPQEDENARPIGVIDTMVDLLAGHHFVTVFNTPMEEM